MRLVLPLTLLAAALTPATPARAETLADALASAYNHSGLLEQNRALLRAADEDVAIALAALRPIITWSASLKRSFGTSATTASMGATVGSASNTASLAVIAQLLLYDFGASQYAIDIAKESVLATRQSLISVEQQVLLRAVQAYMDVRQGIEVVALRQNNVRLITQELRAARDRFEVGEVTRTDVALAEARLAQARSGLAQAQGQLAIAAEAYRAAVGRAPGTLAAPRHLPKTASSLDAARAVAVRNHPDLIAQQFEVSAADLAILRAEAAMKPTLRLTGRLSASENIGNSNYSRGGEFGLEAGGPIYQGGQLSAQLRKAQALRDAQRGALHVIRHSVQQNVGVAWSQLLVAQAARDAANRQIRAARTAFRGVREEASLGARTTLDVLNAEQELLDAQASLISAISNEYVAAYSLLAAMGLLTVDHLNLKVKRYDPAAYYNLVKDGPAITQQGEKLNRVLRALGKE